MNHCDAALVLFIGSTVTSAHWSFERPGGLNKLYLPITPAVNVHGLTSPQAHFSLSNAFQQQHFIQVRVLSLYRFFFQARP